MSERDEEFMRALYRSKLGDYLDDLAATVTRYVAHEEDERALALAGLRVSAEYERLCHVIPVGN